MQLLMTRHLIFALAIMASSLAGSGAAESSWIFRPSYYSHEPAGGARVEQFAAHAPAYARTDPSYQQSAYRHNRASVRVGDSADHLHVVETWGAGEAIRPYGEWLYPFREGATPYGPWGNPQGPWTSPFGSWDNPYALGRLPIPPWVHGYAPQIHGNGPGVHSNGPRGPEID